MSKRRERDDPVAYRIEYSLIAQKLHKATVEREQGHAFELALADEALALIATTVRELRTLGWRWVGSKPPWYVRWARRRHSPEYAHLGKFLDGVLEPAAVILYWSCQVVGEDWESVERLLDGHRDPLKPQPRKQQWPLWRWRLRWRIDLRGYRRRIRQIDRRRFTRRWHREEKAWLGDYLKILASPDVRKRPLIGRLMIRLGLSRLRPLPRPVYRAHYNLACLYSRLAGRRPLRDPQSQGHLSKAREEWDECLGAATGPQERAICEWAEKDPALKALRDDGWVASSGRRVPRRLLPR
jgi:hypothetical protein